MTRRPEIAAAMHDLSRAQHTLTMMLANDRLEGCKLVLKDIDAARTRLIVMIWGDCWNASMNCLSCGIR